VRIYDAEMLWRGVGPCPRASDRRGGAKPEDIKVLLSGDHRLGSHSAGGCASLWQTPANRSQLRRSQRTRLGTLSRAQRRRCTPLASLLVHRPNALEVDSHPRVARRVTRAQLVVVQAGKHSWARSTTLKRRAILLFLATPASDPTEEKLKKAV
jgi:hypothetical protein